MGADEQTVAFYDAEARPYAAHSFEARQLADFMAELPPGAHVLDLGCGAGADSAAMMAAGFSVTSVDASIGLAAEAKRLWNVGVRVMEFSDLDFVDLFDGVWASASLHHARAEHLPGVFAAIRRATKSGGVFHATLKADENDRRDRLGRFYCAMNEAALAELAADWRDVRINSGEGAGYEGDVARWLRLRAVR
jgi:SAM-dependent methyltransferase